MIAARICAACSVALSASGPRHVLAVPRARRCVLRRLTRSLRLRHCHRSGAQRSRCHCNGPRESAGAGLPGTVCVIAGGRPKQRRHRRHCPPCGAGLRARRSLRNSPGKRKAGRLDRQIVGDETGPCPRATDASSALLLFTDADIAHARGQSSAASSRAPNSDRLVLVSLMAKLECGTAAEKLFVPAFVFFFAMLFPFAWVNARPARPPRRRVAACWCGREALLAARGIGEDRGCDHRRLRARAPSETRRAPSGWA